MKNIKPFVLIFSILIIASCSRKNQIVIQGTVSEGSGKYLLLKESTQETGQYMDSVQIDKNDHFKFKLESDIPMFLDFSFSNNNILLIVKPGEIVTINTDTLSFETHYEVTGSPESAKVLVLNQQLNTTMSKIDSLDNLRNSLNTVEDIAEIDEEINSLFKNHKKQIINHIVGDLNSLSNVVALYERLDNQTFFLNTKRDIQYFKIVNDSLSKNYPDIPYVKSLSEITENLLYNYTHEMLLAKASEINQTVPDIYLPDQRGDSVRLSSINKEYILLFFWSPQRLDNLALTRQLIPLYKKYKSQGFEIYQVAFAPNFKNWQKIISYEEIPWISVCESLEHNSKYMPLYNIEQLPTTFLLDKSRENILGKNLSLKQLDLKLNYLLNIK